MNDDLAVEMEALEAIYMDDVKTLNDSHIQLSIKDPSFEEYVVVDFHIPESYPDVPAKVSFDAFHNGFMSHCVKDHLQNTINQKAEELSGMQMLFSLGQEVQEIFFSPEMQEILKGQGTLPTSVIQERTPSPPVVEQSLVWKPHCLDADVCATAVGGTGGLWRFTIGLVGKPSAGKSTFFNSTLALLDDPPTANVDKTDEKEATVGAHPFTTIEPNCAPGFVLLECPCSWLTGCTLECAVGKAHVRKKLRKVPVRMKDVAGLVPGAADGRGKGNRFLNALNEADVFIHVIDASGLTDEEGNVAVDYEASRDVEWISHEVYRWILDNLWGEEDSGELWHHICKKGVQRLRGMLTGYGANAALIDVALTHAGIDVNSKTALEGAGRETAERVAASFAAVRFPMMLALNKCDTEGARRNIDAIRSVFGPERALPVCARAEYVLRKLKGKGLVEYEEGGATAMLSASAASVTTHPNRSEGDTEDRLQPSLADPSAAVAWIQSHVLDRFDSTGVNEIINRAVYLRHPRVVYPVRDVASCASIRAKAPNGKSRESERMLRDCFFVKPNTTVTQVHAILRAMFPDVVGSQFVRASARTRDCDLIQLHKTDVLPDAECVIFAINTRAGAK
eukprot:Rmarinus@m.16957